VTAAEINNAHPFPNRKARRAIKRLWVSLKARRAGYNNPRLLPPGCIHPYAK
jgi:hypothetical protein